MKKLSKYIDHTILKADATADSIKTLCKEAIEFEFKSVCVNPTHVKLANECLKDSDVLTCTVIGFPLGANTTAVKVFETEDAIDNGADEIDMVINVGAVKDENFNLVISDISEVNEVVQNSGKLLKVIFENSLLTNEEIITVTKICSEIGVNFIKTSTGFGAHGATLNHIKLMNDNKSESIQIKASGGVRDLETANKMIEAGATRIGTSSGVKIVS